MATALAMPGDRYSPDYESAIAVASIAPAADVSLPPAIRALEAPPQPPVRLVLPMAAGTMRSGSALLRLAPQACLSSDPVEVEPLIKGIAPSSRG